MKYPGPTLVNLWRFEQRCCTGSRTRARSARDRLGMAKKAPVRGAARTGPQTLMRQRQGNLTLTGAHGRLGQGPVDDVTLRVAAADLP